MQNQQASKWTNAQFTVYPATGGAPYVVEGSQSIIPNPRDPANTNSVARMNVFVTPKSRFTWAGSPQHFYIDTGSEVVGVTFLPFTGLVFVPSLVASSQFKKSNLEELAKHAAANFDYEAVIRHVMGKGNTDNELLNPTFIELRVVFKRALFNQLGAGPEQAQKLASYSIERGILKMDLIRQDVKITGTVWIRIADRTLIRAVENGVQVFSVEAK